MTPPAAACYGRDTARRAAAARRPLRIAAGAQPRPLGTPELVTEVKFLTCTDDNLLRRVVYEGLREDKPASEVRRAVPHPKAAAEKSTDVRARRPRG
jgi:ATP-dependent DNA ligase